MSKLVIVLKRFMCVLFFLIVPISLTGCWSNEELTKRSIVVGVGLDKAADNKIELTLQLVNPSSFSKEHSTSQSKSPVTVVSTTGTTVFDAARSLLSAVDRKPFYSHVQVIVIGEELAKEGLNDILDFFQRDQEPRLTTRLLIAKGTSAKEILNAKSELETIPAVHLRNIMEDNHDSNPAIRDFKLIDLMELSDDGEKNPAITAIEIYNKAESPDITDMKINGTGVFKNGRLVGWLNEEETIGLSYVEDKPRNVVLHISNPFSLGKSIAIEEVRSKIKKNVKLENGKFKGIINVNAEGSVGEIQGNVDFSKPESIKELNEATALRIKSQIQSTLTASQEKFQSDILGFGEIAKRKHNEAWKKSQGDWEEIFSELPIEVNVRFMLRRTGAITMPSKFH